MNTRISAIATNVYVLVTVMPRYSRSILSSILQGKPRSGGNRSGAYTENGTARRGRSRCARRTGSLPILPWLPAP